MNQINYMGKPATTPRSYIRAQVPEDEILAQLAEEAAELAHAALKLRRAQDGTNPTPTSQPDAFKALLEEIADVALMAELLHLDQYQDDIRDTMNRKLLRWKNRLEESRKKP